MPAAHRRRSFNPRRGLALLGSLVRLVCWLIALLLALFIIFHLGGANPANPWAVVVEQWAPRFDLGLGNLFKGVPYSLVINFGIPAVIWLIIGSLLNTLLRRF
jgi:hypothetical protein